ncbi:MAG: type I restriction enzyme HsdR N-terminal domain-containing protein [Bacteroidota bacterium]|jgi:Type I restriction enzyme R protein N terminus (HSDR_N)
MKDFEFPIQELKIRISKSRKEVWCVVRKKWVALTPEEFVRQQAILFFIQHVNWPVERIVVEKQIQINQLKRRPDLVLYNKDFQVHLIAEFKAPSVTLSDSVLEQAAIYYTKLQPKYIVISNGANSRLCTLNANGKWLWLDSFTID